MEFEKWWSIVGGESWVKGEMNNKEAARVVWDTAMNRAIKIIDAYAVSLEVTRHMGKVYPVYALNEVSKKIKMEMQ